MKIPKSAGRAINAIEAAIVRECHRLGKAPSIASHEVPPLKTPTARLPAAAQPAAPLFWKSASMFKPVITSSAAATARMSPLTSASRRCCAQVTQIMAG
jgi:hypothetical protein